ncbi:hypothetical protein PILCRDRAFT_826150 [Piloderma croceum F 1598]|uniref:F-box domain-containing protein n=1 Tax=Piloderma croceum (strain F 1598) TaxID=765440 RepID=A0A0C3ARL9_PILCF|nr:hypothetical protein PILCRDRAFT_826150 [Piloderma croceum F 1598]
MTSKGRAKSKQAGSAEHLRPSVAPRVFAAIEAEEIIDHLHDDNDTLKTCSLVCRAWLLPSRYHLFGRFPSQSSWIAPTKLDDFLGILDSETDNYISPFIRQVHFYNVCSDYSIVPFIPLLNVLNDETLTPAFKSLSFRRYILESDDLDHIPLHRLTYLDITKCTFETFDSLMALFSELSCVEKLLVDLVNVTSKSLPDRDCEAVLLPKLRNLELYAWMVKIIIPLLAPPPTLRDLSFGIHGIDELFIMREFLDDLAPDLNSFSLWYGGLGRQKDIELCLQAIDLKALALLCTFKFDMKNHATLSDIPAVLDQITSPMINHIKISFQVKPADIQPEEGSWRRIPAILARPNFRQLRKLEFYIDRPIHWAEKIEAWIRETLAELELRCTAIQVGEPKVMDSYYGADQHSTIIYFFK